MVAAGVDGPATVEMACVRPDARSDDCRRLFGQMLRELGLPETPPDPRVLSHFVRHDDIGSLLDLVTIADIATAWLHERRQTRDDPAAIGPDAWATDLWYSPAWYLDRTLTRATVVEMLRQAGPDDLDPIGAGPLEALVCDDESALSWVEEQTLRSPSFRAALTRAWLSQQLSSDSFDRVQRAAGAPLPHPNR